MEKKSSQETKLKAKRIRFNLNRPKNERVSLTGDLNGCVLVIPQISQMNEQIPSYQGRLSQYRL